MEEHYNSQRRYREEIYHKLYSVPGALPPTPYFNLMMGLKDIIIVFIFQMRTLRLTEAKTIHLISGKPKVSEPLLSDFAKTLVLILYTAQM